MCVCVCERERERERRERERERERVTEREYLKIITGTNESLTTRHIAYPLRCCHHGVAMVSLLCHHGVAVVSPWRRHGVARERERGNLLSLIKRVTSSEAPFTDNVRKTCFTGLSNWTNKFISTLL